jgi:erythromycin esterase-like protein
MPTQAVLAEINRVAQPLLFDAADYDRLLDEIGDARVVLIGEASHGTHDFYRERIRITQRLIEERGFRAVAAEADWPDAYRVNRFVRDRGHDASALDALGEFTRFPTWMWRNMDVLAFVDWLRQRNFGKAESDQAGFYGLDLYSLNSSMRAVLTYLDKVDPDAAARARDRYACFDQYTDDPQSYGYAAEYGMTKPCHDEAVNQLVEMVRRASELATRDGHVAADELFFAQHNARLVKNAEQYYRSMFAGREESWNVRDRHMAETLQLLCEHLGADSRVVVWAHNSHLGDARATQMSSFGELNLGQLARERFGRSCFNIGFSTYSGEVTAASDWEAPAERKRVRPALANSFESMFHETGIPNFVLPMGDPAVRRILARPHIERAIGVIYLPLTERSSHYFSARISEQFDAVIHLDRTKALIPIDRESTWEHGETPDTYPFAV